MSFRRCCCTQPGQLCSSCDYDAWSPPVLRCFESEPYLSHGRERYFVTLPGKIGFSHGGGSLCQFGKAPGSPYAVSAGFGCGGCFKNLQVNTGGYQTLYMPPSQVNKLGMQGAVGVNSDGDLVVNPGSSGERFWDIEYVDIGSMAAGIDGWKGTPSYKYNGWASAQYMPKCTKPGDCGANTCDPCGSTDTEDRYYRYLVAQRLIVSATVRYINIAKRYNDDGTPEDIPLTECIRLRGWIVKVAGWAYINGGIGNTSSTDKQMCNEFSILKSIGGAGKVGEARYSKHESGAPYGTALLDQNVCDNGDAPSCAGLANGQDMGFQQQATRPGYSGNISLVPPRTPDAPLLEGGFICPSSMEVKLSGVTYCAVCQSVGGGKYRRYTGIDVNGTYSVSRTSDEVPADGECVYEADFKEDDTTVSYNEYSTSDCSGTADASVSLEGLHIEVTVGTTGLNGVLSSCVNRIYIRTNDADDLAIFFEIRGWKVEPKEDLEEPNTFIDNAALCTAPKVASNSGRAYVGCVLGAS